MLPTDDDLLPLIHRMADGDVGALEAFIAGVGPTLHAAFLRATGQSIASVVLVERAIEELWRTSPMYDRHYGTPRTWVLSVARIHSLGHVEKRRGKAARLKSQPDAEQFLTEAGPSDDATAAALDALGSESRTLLEDVWYQGMPRGSEAVPAGEQFASALRAFAAQLAGGE